jgi:hypothetical protein
MKEAKGMLVELEDHGRPPRLHEKGKGWGPFRQTEAVTHELALQPFDGEGHLSSGIIGGVGASGTCTVTVHIRGPDRSPISKDGTHK